MEQKIKSYKECCSEVANKHWGGKNLVIGHAPKYWEEAAEIYASQFKTGKSKLDLDKISKNIDELINHPDFVEDFKRVSEKNKQNEQNEKPSSEETLCAKLRNQLSPHYGLPSIVLMMLDGNPKLKDIVIRECQQALDNKRKIDELLIDIENKII